MTSKILSTNLIKGSLKRKIWLYIATLLTMLAIRPGNLLMEIDRMLYWSYNLTKPQMIDQLIYQLTPGRSVFLFTMAAVIYAFVSFGYTYSRPMVDMYHSLPTKRKNLYAIFAGTAIIPYLVIEAITTLLIIGVLVLKGLVNSLIIRTVLSTATLSIVFFVLIFSIAVIAISLTGNFFVGIIGTGFFIGAASFVFELIDAYKGYCFQTYYYNEKKAELFRMILSPFRSMQNVSARLGDNPGAVVAWCIEATMLFILAGYLYCKKPSECTYKSLCYNILQPIIRIPSVACVALFGGLYIVYIRGVLTAGWYWIIFIVVGVISHALISAILNNDFRKVFADWKQLIISLAVAAAIGSIFLFDIFGYDRYLPKENEIAYAGITFTGIHSDINNFEPEERSEGAALSYISQDTYRLNHLKTTDFSSVLQLADAGIANINSERSVFKRKNNDRNVTYDADEYSEANGYVIKYHLKNGRDVYRSYAATIEETYAATEKIYNTKEYKDSIIQLDECMMYGKISEIHGFDTRDTELFKLSENDAQVLVEAIKQDYYSMTLEDLAKELPLVKFSAYQYKGTYNDILSGYYIYPGFVNTIAFLKSKGIDIDTSTPKLKLEQIQSINISRFEVNPDGNSVQMTATYEAGTDDEMLKKLNDIIVLDNFSYSNSVLKKYDYSVDINCTYLTDKGYIYSSYVRIPKGALPEEVYLDLKESADTVILY